MLQISAENLIEHLEVKLSQIGLETCGGSTLFAFENWFFMNQVFNLFNNVRRKIIEVIIVIEEVNGLFFKVLSTCKIDDSALTGGMHGLSGMQSLVSVNKSVNTGCLSGRHCPGELIKMTYRAN